MHCHTALRDEHCFVFEAFRISTGKEGEKSSGSFIVRIQHLQREASTHLGDFVW